MDRFYYLSSCDTCKRILKTLELLDSIERVDIKKHPLREEEPADFCTYQSYEALLNKRAQKLKAFDIDPNRRKSRNYCFLTTLLKRPVLAV